MKKLIFIALFLFGFNLFSAPNISYSIIALSDNNLLIVGSVVNKIYLQKITPKGEIIFKKDFSASYCGEWNGKITNKGAIESGKHIYISYHNQGILHLIKFNLQGIKIWDKEFPFKGSDGVVSFSINADIEDNLLVIGKSLAPDFDVQYVQINIFKIDQEGKIIWQKNLGESYIDDIGFDIVVNAANDYFVIGNIGAYGSKLTPKSGIVLTKLKSTGEQEWSFNFSNPEKKEVAYKGSPTSDGGFVITGQSDGLMLLRTHDESGKVVNSTTYFNGKGRSVIETKDKGFILTGSGPNQNEKTVGITIKTDKSGNHEWYKFIQKDLNGLSGLDLEFANNSAEGTDIIEDSDGNFFLLGYIGDEIAVVKYDSKGELLWGKKYSLDK